MAPYPEHRAWHPQGAPGGGHGPDGYGGTFDGGGYAYVIHEDDPATPPPAGARTRHRGHLGEWPTAAQPAPGSGKPADVARTSTAAIRAITAGAADAVGVRNRADAAGNAHAEGAVDDLGRTRAYGPDDPAYGPPEPGRYGHRPQDSQVPDGAPVEDDGDALPVRGPFEPLRSSDERDAAGSAGYPAAEDETAPFGRDYDHDEAPSAAPDYQPLDHDLPDAFDFWAPSNPEADALGQIKDLYQAAETVDPAGFDSHFDQLLERQRRLISEYFEESGGTAPGEEPPSQAPLGFDSAESLSELRGELHGAP